MINGVPQKPIEGTSLVYTFNDAKAATKHTTQYFEMLGNRAIYRDGWMASTTPLRMPWAPPWCCQRRSGRLSVGALPRRRGFLAGEQPRRRELPTKLKELQAIFAQEAKKYNVYPLDTPFAERADVSIRPSLTEGRNTFTYYPGDRIRIPEGATPDVKNRDFTVTAEIENSRQTAGADRCARHAGRTVRRLGIAPQGRQTGI